MPALTPREQNGLDALQTCLSDTIYHRVLNGTDPSVIACEWNTTAKAVSVYLDHRYGPDWRTKRNHRSERISIRYLIAQLKLGRSCWRIAKDNGVSPGVIYYMLQKYRQDQRKKFQSPRRASQATGGGSPQIQLEKEG